MRVSSSSKFLITEISKRFKVKEHILTPMVNEILETSFTPNDLESLISEAKGKQDRNED